MKRSIIFITLTIIITFSSCKKEKESSNTSSSNISNTGSSQGTLEISITHPEKWCDGYCTTGVKHTVGLGYSSSDIQNNAFFTTKTGTSSGITYSFTLDKGTYYYKGIVCCDCCNDSGCNSIGLTSEGYCSPRPGKSGSGSATISDSQMFVTKSINL